MAAVLKASKRGRVFRCKVCCKEGERSKIVSHYMLWHVAPSDVPFMCTFCQFRCSKKKDLEHHVAGYRLHVERIKREGDPGPSCLVESGTPFEVVDGIHIERLNQIESWTKWANTRRTPTQTIVSPSSSTPVVAAVPALSVPVPLECDIPLGLWDLASFFPEGGIDAPTYVPTPIVESAVVPQAVPIPREEDPIPSGSPESHKRRRVESEGDRCLEEQSREVRRLQSEVTLANGMKALTSTLNTLVSDSRAFQEVVTAKLSALETTVTTLTTEITNQGRILEQMQTSQSSHDQRGPRAYSGRPSQRFQRGRGWRVGRPQQRR